ncbi:MAG: hypothetical protein JWM33_307 [Caulobacteraceae bacterium]|nr:hypothetical protein [Caulobacteraceae bacterium]
MAMSLVLSKAKLEETLRDPGTAKYKAVLAVPFVTNDGSKLYIFCGRVNSKNGFGGYAGFTRFIATTSGAVVETDNSFESAWQQRCVGAGRPATF